MRADLSADLIFQAKPYVILAHGTGQQLTGPEITYYKIYALINWQFCLISLKILLFTMHFPALIKEILFPIQNITLLS